MKKYIILLVVFLLGVTAGLILSIRSSNSKVQAAHERAKKVDSINTIKQDSLYKLQIAARDSVLYLDSILTLKNKELAVERTKIISRPRIEQLENIIIEQGVKLYGEANQGNSRRALIASYGANAITEVNYSRPIIENQKVQIVYQAGILELENEIRVEYQKGLEIAAKECKPNQVKKGFLFGSGATALVFLILLL